MHRKGEKKRVLLMNSTWAIKTALINKALSNPARKKVVIREKSSYGTNTVRLSRKTYELNLFSLALCFL